VGGLTPAFVDELASLRDRMPYALVLLGLSMLVILFAFTRSVLLPVKTLLMNVLTIAAFVGLLVVVFDWLRLSQPPGAVAALEVSTLLVTVVAAFGLATDYGVFVLSRIAEAHQSGLSNEDAVAIGMERTGRLVTAAALLFSVAVGAFVSSELVFVKELSVGLVSAVLLDATIVRALLVPALMRLLGGANWWSPRWRFRRDIRPRSRPRHLSTTRS
jgi:RND superfamily putative drug exporter